MNIEIDRQSNRKSELTNVCSPRQESLLKQTKWKTITNEQWRQKQHYFHPQIMTEATYTKDKRSYGVI